MGGRASEFRALLRQRQERYVLDVPCNTTVRDLEGRRPPRKKGQCEPKTPKGYPCKTSKMMKIVLEQAWISYRDKGGRFADFHANRHTFISNLSRAGVPLATARKRARHSNPRLTANRYTHLGLDD